MGRRPLAVLLLRHGADPNVKNKRGATPASVCTDPGTRELFKGTSFSALSGAPTTDSKGGVRGDASDRTTCCVPFFVPRQPLFLDCAHSAELVSLCSEMLDRSVGHGLAFCVAVGVVKDRPTDLSHFLLEQRTNPKRLGEFLGEELSMSETLRLAFMDSMDLFNTGVVNALCRAFRHIHAPQNFGKIDRLTTAVAHMWWRAHDVLEDIEEDSLLGARHREPAPRLEAGEISGMELRRHMRSVEGLQRLMFSTVMLYWAMHGSPVSFPLPASVSKDHLSIRGWIDMNLGIEVDGTNVPSCVVEGIYRALSQQVSDNLLPSFVNIASPRSVETALPCIQGWAIIPPGGLERYEPVMPAGAGLPRTPHLAQCILSEASPTPALTPRTHPADGHSEEAMAAIDAGAEVVWLTLRFSLILFLATSPSDAAPYAFVRLTDAALRDVDRQSRHLVLAGRPRKSTENGKDKLASDGTAAELWHSPFGDMGRCPLELCFLLRDGRFQSFGALWLELRFMNDEDLELWLRELGAACRETPPLAPGSDLEAVGKPRFSPSVSPAAKPRMPPPDATPLPPRQPRMEHTPAPLSLGARNPPGTHTGDDPSSLDEAEASLAIV
mmetsp:Transcript_101436/g.316248  ORF Transcript_101436/g.316248 Transcript_101436/m.316248 type:complete len:609 (+) Transcript_101436:3-1829(+)